MKKIFIEDESYDFESILCKKRLSTLVDLYKNELDEYNESSLYRLLENKELLKKLIEDVTTKNDDFHKNLEEDTKYLLKQIDNPLEVLYLARNEYLLKYAYENHLLTNTHINTFNTLMNYTIWLNKMKINESETFFGLVESFMKENEVLSDESLVVLKLNEMYKKRYELSDKRNSVVKML